VPVAGRRLLDLVERVVLPLHVAEVFELHDSPQRLLLLGPLRLRLRLSRRATSERGTAGAQQVLGSAGSYRGHHHMSAGQ
jgi:hypothetical protein